MSRSAYPTRRPAAKPMTSVPRWLRPKLTSAQQTDLGIVHAGNVDEIVRGLASEQTLWDMVNNVLVWSHVAEQREVGIPEITEQLHMVSSLVLRFGKTGVIRFEGQEYDTACHGIAVMDAMAAEVDQHLASQAVAWATERTNEWRAAFDSRQQRSQTA